MPQFSLQTALNVRERIEKTKQKAFAEQIQVAQQLKDEMQALEARLIQSAQEENQAKMSGFSVQQLVFHQRYRQRLKREIRLLAQKQAQHEQLLERHRQEVLKASQDKKALEVLKEREGQRWQKKQRKLEMAEMDEIAQNMKMRSKLH